MKISLRTFSGSTLFVLSLGLIALFQNCGGSGFVAGVPLDSVVPQTTLAFAYPYSEKPLFYKDVALFATPEQLASLSSFEVTIAVAYLADASAPVKYDVQITDPVSGGVMCPRQTGELTAGSTSLSFKCVSAVLSTHPQVRLAFEAAGVSEVSTRSF